MLVTRKPQAFAARALMAVILATALPVCAQAPARDTDERSDRMRALVGMTPIVNYVPLPSSNLGNDKSATWFLDPNRDRVIHCAGNPTTGIRCTSTAISPH